MTELKDLLQSADWKKEKHVPVIDGPAGAKKGEAVHITVTVGREIAHPNTTAHHIAFLAAYFLPDVSTKELQIWMFFVLAFFSATSLGGIQALSRSFFAGLIPAERSAEFFGFYNIFGKFATVLGPALLATATRFTGHSRYGVLSVLVLFIIGGALLLRVEKESPLQAAE